MAFAILIFIVAAAISGVAAYFSLVGLGSIFAATFWGVVVMGGALEVGKIITTKWVHGHWRSPEAPWYFRALLCFFIACLMAITSLGIYGYLSRGHLEQKAPLAGLAVQVEQLEVELAQKKQINTQLAARQDQISRITDKSLESSGRAALRASTQQRREAAEIQKRLDLNNQEINALQARLVPLRVKSSNVEGELGVAKFIAEAMGWEPEKAIRIIISLIMAAFDPLALSMFIMGGISLEKARAARRQAQEGPVPPSESQEAPPVVQATPVIPEVPETTPLPVPEIQDSDISSEILAEIHQDREELALRMGELQETKGQMLRDQSALNEAHQQLMEMEARLNDERELLGQWQSDLTKHQEAINAWQPERHDVDDGRDPKDLIIELLEMNPDIVNDIVQVAMALRNAKPGL